jgi:hypothetical protein
MNEFQPFEHEVMASQNEKAVEYNLSESGVHPLLQKWIDHQQDTFRLVPPQAAVIAFVRCRLD